jgi:tetratricopeptide (TPR) repeat protein
MKSKRIKITVEVILAIGLVAGALYFWGQKLGWHSMGAGGLGKGTLSSASGRAQSSTNVSPGDSPWAGNYPDFAASDLVVLPLVEESRLLGNLNFELRETSARLIPAYLFVGGRKVTVPESWPLYAALHRAGQTFSQMKHLDSNELVALGKKLKTKTILQVRTRYENGRMSATADGIEVATQKALGPWEVSLPPSARTYESLFDVQCALAPIAAAGLLGLPGAESLLAPSGGPSVAQADRHAAQTLAETALAQIRPGTLPRFMKALRMANEAIEKDPRCLDAWVTVALVSERTASKVMDTETQIGREMVMRALVAGEVAHALAPENPRARLARAYAWFATGRIAQGIQEGKRVLDKEDSHWVDCLWATIMTKQRERFPQIPPAASPTESALWNFISDRMEYLDPKADKSEIIRRWLMADVMAPYYWSAWGDLNQLNESRMGHTYCSILGSLLTIEEGVRQLERAGKSKEAARILDRLNTPLDFFKKVSADKRTDASRTPITDAFSEKSSAWAKDEGPRILPKAMRWEPDQIGIQLFAAAEQARKEALKVLGEPIPLLRKPGSGLDLSPAHWIELAQRPALDGIAWSFGDIAWRFSDKNSALALGESALAIRPDDLALLEAHAFYYRSVNFDNSKVDHYQTRMFSLDHSYGPAVRRSATFKQGDQKTKIEAIEKIKYICPFHFTSLKFIIDQLESLGESGRAADYARLMLTRYPNAHDYRFTEIELRAAAQERLITAEEVERVAQAVPLDYPDRHYLMARMYRWANQPEKSLEFYTLYFDEHAPDSITSYQHAAWLWRLLGQYDKAIDTLEAYIRIDPSSLKTCSALVEISWIELWRGNLNAAIKACNRAAAIDDWKGEVISQMARMEWFVGNHDKALSHFARSARRYESTYSYSLLGWAQLAKGDVEGALRSAESAIKADVTEWGFALKNAILLRQGKIAEAEEPLNAMNGRLIHDEAPQRLLALHHLRLGDTARAVSHAENAFLRARTYNHEKLLPVLCRTYIENRNFDKARICARKFHATNPLLVQYDCLMGRIALAEGNASGVADALGRALRVGDPDAYGILARAELQLGNFQNAYDHAKRANFTNIHPETEWLLTQADASLALGNTNEAAELYKRCAELEGPATVLGKEAARKLQSLTAR